MRVIDCFPYFNEKELLELRINLLYDHVDKFIICDADRTHSGKPKPFLCRDVINELNLPQDKIQIVEVNLPLTSPDDWVSGTWVRERMQRNAAAQFIEDGDVCYIGDCDEIINPKYIHLYSSLASEHPNNILRVPLVFLNGKANLRVHDQYGNPKSWNCSYFCMKHHTQRYTLSDIREACSMGKSIDFSDIFYTEYGEMVESGWHFSWMGDIEKMKTKCTSFLHHDEYEVSDDYIPEENSTDPLGRTDHILKKYPINLLPDKIFELDRVNKFLLDEVNITEKYGIKMTYDQHGHLVSENFCDPSENLAYKLFDNNVSNLKSKHKKTYNMIELGSNYAYYSMLFKKILGVENTFNLLLEPYDDYMKLGKEHFAKNSLEGVFLKEGIYNAANRWNNITFDCEYTSIDELLERYSINELDVLHCDIDTTEVYALYGAEKSLKNKKIDLLFIMTHTLPQIMDMEYQNSLKGIPTYLHSKCKEIMANYDYQLLYDHPELDLGSDGMLIFKKNSN